MTLTIDLKVSAFCKNIEKRSKHDHPISFKINQNCSLGRPRVDLSCLRQNSRSGPEEGKCARDGYLSVAVLALFSLGFGWGGCVCIENPTKVVKNPTKIALRAAKERQRFSEGVQNGAKGRPEGPKWSRRARKGSQNGAKGRQKATKMHPKIDLRKR